MEKPKIETKTEKYYDYDAIVNYIGEKYNIDVRDYLGSSDHMKKYVENKEQTFEEWLKENPRPQYLDFWHWLCDEYEESVKSGSILSFNIKEHLDSDDTPKWVKKILILIRKEFEPMTIDKWGEHYDFLIEW